MKIAMDVMQVLDRAQDEGNALKLTQQLVPALYKRVNKVLMPPAGNGIAWPKPICSTAPPQAG